MDPRDVHNIELLIDDLKQGPVVFYSKLQSLDIALKWYVLQNNSSVTIRFIKENIDDAVEVGSDLIIASENIKYIVSILSFVLKDHLEKVYNTLS